MTMPPTSDSCLPTRHPLRGVRGLVDQTLDELAGVVAADESAASPGLARRVVRAVILQRLCDVHSDAAMASGLRIDAGFRWFVGFGADEVPWRAEQYAQLRRSVLALEGFEEFIAVLIGVLRRRGLVDDAMFAAAPIPEPAGGSSAAAP